jgi:hypothetical protein
MKKLLLTAALFVVSSCVAQADIDTCCSIPDEYRLCLDIRDLSVNTNQCLNRLKVWKAKEDRNFLRNCATLHMIRSDFITEEERNFLQTVNKGVNSFFDGVYGMLLADQDSRDVAWYTGYMKEIGTINDVVSQHSTDQICAALEYKAMISQKIVQYEKMLNDAEITVLDFCKNCWLVYADTGIERITNIIDDQVELLSKDDIEMFEVFKSDHPAKKLPEGSEVSEIDEMDEFDDSPQLAPIDYADGCGE